MLSHLQALQLFQYEVETKQKAKKQENSTSTYSGPSNVFITQKLKIKN